MRDIEESRAVEAIRAYLESPAARERAVTAEWLAGRLGLPLPLCDVALGRLIAARAIRRIRRSKAAPVYLRADATSRRLGGRLVIALGILAVITVAIFIALHSRYVFIGAEALAIGLIIAFAWLDAELHDSRPPR